MSKMPKGKITAGAALAALIGFAAANMSTQIVSKYEGEVLRGYSDPVGIATKCYGDTTEVILGKEYTRDECLSSLETQLIAHAGPMLDCLGLDPEEFPHQTAAFVSLAYHIGTKAFCQSTVARRWRAGDYAGACAAISLWNKADGKVWPSFVRRREEERALCERDLPSPGAAGGSAGSAGMRPQERKEEAGP
jgi:lysozyme